jgi:hypothetical protein
MAKPKINPQMIRRMQQVAQEEKIPQSSDGENNSVENQHGLQNFDQNQKNELQELKIKKEAFAQKRIGEIEGEMRALSQQRQEEMRKRREEMIEHQGQESEQKKVQGGSPLEISSKPKKGMPFWGKRIKTAQQQSQPETAGRRTSG